MEQQISDLLDIIRKEISLYRDLIEHARKKTDLLAQGRIDAILESNKAEESFSTELSILAKKMRRICNEISLSFGISGKDFTIDVIADNLEQSIASEINSQKALFKDIVRQWQSVTQHNMRLTEKSLRYSKGLLGIISNATSPYQRTGLFRPIPSVQPTFSHRV